MSAAEERSGTPALGAGRTLGRYTIVSRLAAGGMAEVWLAELHGIAGFRRRVVLKTILPHLAVRDDYVKMFVTEAETAARLNHPNVVSVFDLGCLDGVYFMAMEYVPGRSLREMARRAPGRRLPPWVVLESVRAVARGLQYVHDCADESGRPLGLVHCDVSPDNVIVSFTGNVTLVDFGIVSRAAIPDDDPDLIKGKFRFIAPERLRGQPLDRRGDIYALGVTLYELLTGARIYDGETYELLASAITGGPRRPREVCPEIPPPLEAIVLRAIAVDPAHRYAEALDLESALASRSATRAARSRELGQYVCSLFPDASDIPVDQRRSVGLSPPASHMRMTAVRPREPPAASDTLRDEAPSHVSIELDELISGPPPLPTRAAPRPSIPPPPSVPPAALESGVRHSSPDRREALDRIAALEAARDPNARASDDGGVWGTRVARPSLCDVFTRGSRPPPPAHDVFGVTSARAHPPPSTRESQVADPPPPREASAAVREAARRFDAGLRLCGERRYLAALIEWEAAAALDPARATYQTNLKKLKSVIDRPR